MAIIAGRIVRTPAERQPYKVVLEYEGAATLEYPVATVREGEALIRGKTAPPARADSMVRGLAVPGAFRDGWRGRSKPSADADELPGKGKGRSARPSAPPDDESRPSTGETVGMNPRSA